MIFSPGKLSDLKWLDMKMQLTRESDTTAICSIERGYKAKCPTTQLTSTFSRVGFNFEEQSLIGTWT